jgi:hypothetical protein
VPCNQVDAVIELLAKSKGVIAGKWLDRIVASYPADSSGFLKRKGDRFTNPVGATLSQGTAAIVDALVDGVNLETVRDSLEPIVKIRAVQDFSPSSALAFVFQLKDVIRDVLGSAAEEPRVEVEMRRLDAYIDRMALLAFDLYSGCREQVAEVRVSEVKRSVAHVLRRSGWFEDPQQGGDR